MRASTASAFSWVVVPFRLPWRADRRRVACRAPRAPASCRAARIRCRQAPRRAQHLRPSCRRRARRACAPSFSAHPPGGARACRPCPCSRTSCARDCAPWDRRSAWRNTCSRSQAPDRWAAECLRTPRTESPPAPDSCASVALVTSAVPAVNAMPTAARSDSSRPAPEILSDPTAPAKATRQRCLCRLMARRAR